MNRRSLMIGASLVAASQLARSFTQIPAASPAAKRVFELRIYHALPGMLPVMETRFREKTSKILARHNLHVLAYWVTEDPTENTFVFLLAHTSREEARKAWDAFRVDPEFQEVAKSEQAERTLEKADILWLRPTDFSPMS